jgi:DNA-binding NarL/FixJ family response regulator
VVVTGAAEEVPRVLEAVQMGVRGWVDKADTADTLVAAVRAAGHGESRIPAEMLTKALMYLSAGGPAATPEQEAIGRLTNRERDVLYGLMDGLSRTQIGELLKVSPNTVRTHVQSILSKLNVHSALGAVALARKAGVSRESADA